MYTLTEQEMERIVQYINGDAPDVISTDIPARLLKIAADLQKRLIKDTSFLLDRNKTLQQQIRRLKDKHEEAFAAGDFRDHEAEFHDTDLAMLAIHHLLAQEVRYAMPTVMHMVYLAYAAGLTKGVRLCVEPPVVTKQGPWFWRIRNRMENLLYQQPDKEQIDSIRAADPGLYVLMKNVVAKYRDVDTIKMLCNTEPVRRNGPSANGGKWNKIIPDAQIWNWQKNKKQ